MNKSILIISYKIGNDKSVGGKRWLNYSNFLSKKGFLVSVLAAEHNIDFDNLDKRVKVYSIKSKYPRILDKNKLSLFERIYYKLANFYQKLTVKGSLYDKGKKLENKLINKVSEIICENNLQNIIVSGAPFSFLYYLTKHFKGELNLICDFRDPWTWGIGYGMSILSKKRIEYEKYCENFVLENSNYITCASIDLSNILNNKLKKFEKQSIVLVNATDNLNSNSNNHKSHNVNETIRIAHIGTISLNTEKYWKLFLDLIELSKFDVELNFYGNNNVSFLKDVKKRKNLKVNFHSRIEEKLLLKELLSNNITLLFKMDVFPNTFPTKFFDYLRVRKPIIAFTKKGIFSDEIESNNIGIIFNENTNIDELDNFLASYGNISYKDYDFSKFEISNEIKKLIEIFK